MAHRGGHAAARCITIKRRVSLITSGLPGVVGHLNLVAAAFRHPQE
jgi:hypothetical protein